MQYLNSPLYLSNLRVTSSAGHVFADFCLATALECYNCTYTITNVELLGQTTTDETGDEACSDNPASLSTVTCDGECFVSIELYMNGLTHLIVLYTNGPCYDC